MGATPHGDAQRNRARQGTGRRRPGLTSRARRAPLLVLAGLWLVPGLGPAGAGAQTPSDAAVARAVREALEGDDGFRAVRVSVADGEATLAGRVPTLRAKTQAIERSLRVDGIERVVSELAIPRVEDERRLAQAVVASIVTYPVYTMFDYVHGGVRDGVVMLAGDVTPERDKAGELVDRIARIPGVQDIRSTVETLPVGAGDTRLRRVLAASIFANDFFHRYARLRLPPFHVIVRRGTVTLTGFVRDRVERRVLEQVVRGTFGVTRVVNELDTERAP